MIPADLLNQLRERDPELCGRMRRMPVYVHQDEQLTIDLTKSDNTELVAAWLQHCLQNAVRARGWYLTQWTQSDPIFPEIECVIHCPIKKEVPSGYKGSLFNDYFGRGDTEAEALLQAYLSALSASQ